MAVGQHCFRPDQLASRLQHTKGLSDDGGLVGDVHADVETDRRVKGVVGKRQFCCVGLLKTSLFAEAAHPGQPAGRLDEGRCQVDPVNVAATGGGKEARRAANAAADIQDPVGR